MSFTLPYSLLDDESSAFQTESYEQVEDPNASSAVSSDSEDSSIPDSPLDRSSVAPSFESTAVSIDEQGAIVSLPPGTLIEMYRMSMGHRDESNTENDNDEESSLGRTILSSAPSEAQVVLTLESPPPPVQDIWAISPHPRLVGASSITTSGSTEYMELPRHEGEEGEEETSLSLHASSVDSSAIMLRNNSVIICRSNGPPSSLTLPTAIDAASFMTVANALVPPSTTAEQGGRFWYEQFTERDWENFQNVAHMVANALDPPSTRIPVALPPPAPTSDLPLLLGDTPRRDHASKLLPPEFVCPMCRDSIVGATTLDCGCEASTICASCWESYIQASTRNEIVEVDYVWVHDKPRCPSCFGAIHSFVACHALDVALLQLIQNLPPTQEHCHLQMSYYHRLNEWRDEQVRRSMSTRQSLRHDQLLAELIQQEEEAFWSQTDHLEQERVVHWWNRGLARLGEVTALVAIAAVATIGVGSMGARRTS